MMMIIYDDDEEEEDDDDDHHHHSIIFKQGEMLYESQQEHPWNLANKRLDVANDVKSFSSDGGSNWRFSWQVEATNGSRTSPVHTLKSQKNLCHVLPTSSALDVALSSSFPLP